MSDLGFRLFFLSVATMAVFACDKPKPGSLVDQAKIEKAATDLMVSRGITPKAVACKGGQLAKGDHCDCDVTLPEGDKLVLDCVATDDQGNIDLNAKAGVPLNPHKLSAAFWTKKLGADTTGVTCPDKGIILKTNTSFTCDVTHAGKPGKLTVTATNDTGDLDFKIDGAVAVPPTPKGAQVDETVE